jgi:hypothetical protein
MEKLMSRWQSTVDQHNEKLQKLRASSRDAHALQNSTASFSKQEREKSPDSAGSDRSFDD